MTYVHKPRASKPLKVLLHTLKEQGQLITSSPRSSPQKNAQNWSKLDHTDCSMLRVWCISLAAHRGCDAYHLPSVQGAMHTKFLLFRPHSSALDKWQGKNVRWKIMESSRSFPYDICLSIFNQGWVRDHHFLSGSRNYQREDTNKDPKRWLTSL